VSVKNIEKDKWEDREIRRFLGEKDIYKLEDVQVISEMIIENKLNGGIEGKLPKIIDELDCKDIIHPNTHLAIAENTANFLCRNISVRNWIQGWLKKDNLREFFDFIIKATSSDTAANEKVFNNTNQLPEKDKINTYMVLYMNYVSNLLRSASIEVIVGTEEYQYFTSDNPVCLEGIDGYGKLEDDEMEIYFAISNKYLIKFYWHNEGEQQERKFIEVSKTIYDKYHDEILPAMAINFIICPMSREKLLE